MDSEQQKILSQVANTVRGLSIDGVQKANSGHPGLPLGCAELGAYLWGAQMRYNPKNERWLGRDRFVLSAGHGSMWLYSLLHLSGYKVSLEDLKKFRQLHSCTPGHPEYGDTDGVETTTGPLGQGIASATGMALGLKILGKKFNTEKHKLFDNKVFCLCGDGCIMEGISSESASFAGHVGLDNFVLIYDSNKITLDGPLADSCSENTAQRYRAYGFEVYEVDGYNFGEMEATFNQIREKQDRPVMVIVHTIIGKGSPHKAGTHKVHGSPLGPEEVKATKEELGISLEDFYVPSSVKAFFDEKKAKDEALEGAWEKMFAEWKSVHPDLAKEFEAMLEKKIPQDIESELMNLEVKDPIAGRSASNAVINFLAEKLPYLYGGSADLSGSDMTMIAGQEIIEAKHFSGRNFKYGVREFAMAAMTSGLELTQMMLPFCGTFLTFSDYMRNAIRLSALMRLQVVYQFTHDSIFLGEDGPTHQPVEHFASLRTIPNLHVIRPADTREVKMAWLSVLRYQGPTAIILSRQSLPLLEGTDTSYAEGMGRGGYVIHKESGATDYLLIATGSEVQLALEVAERLEKRGKGARVVSMPCTELFDKQDKAYQDSAIGGNFSHRVSIEAGVANGWHKYIGREGTAICMESFGLSAPAADLAKEFGFTADAILERILS